MRLLFKLILFSPSRLSLKQVARSYRGMNLSRAAREASLAYGAVPERTLAAQELGWYARRSFAAIIRSAIHRVLFRSNPGPVDRMIDAELDRFLKRMGEKFLVAGLKGTKRSAFRKQIKRLIH